MSSPASQENIDKMTGDLDVILPLSLESKWRKVQEKSDSFVSVRNRPTPIFLAFDDNRSLGLCDFSRGRKENDMKEKFITTAELANGASKVLAGLKRGTGTVILRYSDPVGVLISWDDYKQIENLERAQINACKSCITIAKKELK